MAEEETPAASLTNSQLKSDWTQNLSVAALTAFGYAWLPVFDLLTVRYLIGFEQAGLFSQLQLFSKILYYAPLTLLQISLPHYVRILSAGHDRSELKGVRKFEWQGMVLSYLGVIVFAFTGPYACKNILHIQEFSAVQISLICLAVIPQYGLLSGLQILAAANRCKLGAVLLGSTLLMSALAFLFRWKTIDEYLLYSAIANSILGFAAWRFSFLVLREKEREGNPLPLPPVSPL